jgi:hypothetical protein
MSLKQALQNEKLTLTDKEEIKMAFYIHLGCKLTGSRESNWLIDQWIHMVSLCVRLEIMETVLEL